MREASIGVGEMIAELKFDLSNDDDAIRFKKVINAEAAYSCLHELDQWLRNEIKYCEHSELQPARDALWKVMTEDVKELIEQ